MNTRTINFFHGGVHPPENKTLSNSTPIVPTPLPSKLVVPLLQSIGNRARLLVNVGDHVLKGQRIGAPDGAISVAAHAPTSGIVTAIEPARLAHPSGLTEMAVTITPDGEDRWIERQAYDWRNAESRAVREYLRDMGVVGLGGAIFPSHLKLVEKGKVNTLIVNGAECEPYITCDDRLMRERAAGILAGTGIVRELLGASTVLIGIEDNKPEAAAAMREAIKTCGFAAEVVVVPTLYPSGAAKQMYKLLTGIEVPSGTRATDLGLQCFNVGTLYSIWRAIEFGEAAISRVVTLTGNVERPGNYEALIGAPLSELLQFAGEKPSSVGYVYGGPMMGFELPAHEVTLSKAGNCIIAQTPETFPERPLEMPCIRCGNCAEACPIELQPMDLYWFARSKRFDKSQQWQLFDCIECGACAYVCPSNIRLVDYFRYSKSEIWDEERQKKDADHARQRHEFHQFREEREKREKAERLAAKAAQKHEQAVASSDPADAERAAKIKAAMERAAAKNADAAIPASAPAAEPAAIDPEKAERIRLAMEKRAAEKAAADAMTPEEKAAKEAEKQAKIAAAMERAAAKKAEKAAQEGATPTETAPVAAPVAPVAEPVVEAAPAPALDPEKAERIRLAMEKRAAEKAALDAMSPEEKAAKEAEKQARIQAAKERAAEKKAEQNGQKSE